MEAQEAAYETSEYRGCRVHGYYGKDGVGEIIVLEGGNVKLKSEVPAYKIWNFNAHYEELIDSLLDAASRLPVEPVASVELPTLSITVDDVRKSSMNNELAGFPAYHCRERQLLAALQENLELKELLEEVDATLCRCRYDGQGDDCNCDIHAAHKLIATKLGSAR